MANTDNLVLEHLRAIRSDIARLANRMETMSVELTAIRQHLGGVVTYRITTRERLPRSSRDWTGSSGDWN
jgi:hypothetical protein